MRCLAHCLVLLMAPTLATASNVVAGDGQGGCVYASPEGERAPSARNAAAAVPTTVKPAPAPAAATTTTGGGGDDDVLQRIRAPKWHSFLPGMFR